MYTISELKQIQKEATQRSHYPGVLVISKNALVDFIRQKISEPFSLALLNQAISQYCKRGYAVKLVLGAKKWNLDASRVPAFLDWFFEEYYTHKKHGKSYIGFLNALYESQHIQGKKDYSKRQRVVQQTRYKLSDI